MVVACGLVAPCMWDLPRPGLEPVSPVLAGGFLTTVPPRKSLTILIYVFSYTFLCEHVYVSSFLYVSFFFFFWRCIYPTRDLTRALCSLNHWTTREVPLYVSFLKTKFIRDFPGGPVVKTAGVTGSIFGWGTRSRVLHLRPRTAK